MTRIVLACALALGAVGIAAPEAAATGACASADLSGTFTEVPGTHAIGSVRYALTLTNTGTRACVLSGRPSLQLLGKDGARVPTHAAPAGSAASFTLQPLASATSTAVLAVDVPGAGDVSRPGSPCEPLARRVVVGTALAVPLSPPASVCRRGAITYGAFVVLVQQAIPPALLTLIRTVIRLPIYEYTLRLHVDPADATWAEWSFGPAGPQDQIQGGLAFAHRTGGRWRDVAGPGSAGVCKGVPAAVLHALHLSGC